jgi:hypothetical protein
MEPLASFGNSSSQPNTNVSTSITISIFDRNGNEVFIEKYKDQLIEIIIPRDPNIIISSMILQNVTLMNSISQIDGWTLLCLSGKFFVRSIYRYYFI